MYYHNNFDLACSLKHSPEWRVQLHSKRLLRTGSGAACAENHAKTITGYGPNSNCFFQKALEGNALVILTRNGRVD